MSLASGATFVVRRASGHTRQAPLIGLGSSRRRLAVGTAAILLLALLVGGGTTQGLWSDAVVQVASLFLIGAALLRARRAPAPGERWATLVIAAIVALPTLQLVPLPPSLWMRLPGRASIATGFVDARVALPWLPISLDPGATLRSLLSLLPPIAIFFATLGLGQTARRTLTLLVIAVGVVSVALGFLQISQGPSSPLRFFPITNPSSPVGFFANVNHEAAFLYCLIPLVAAWMIGMLNDRRSDRTFGLVVGLLTYAVFFLGLGMALSRAGIILALAAAVASLAIAARNDQRFGNRGLAIVAVAIVVGTLLVTQFALFKVVDQFDVNPLQDLRVQIARITLAAGNAFQPFGAGFGTFIKIYPMFEAPADLTSSYANHAHDDWLEIWLEGGWAAVAIAVAFVGWFITASVRIWQRPQSRGGTLDRAVAQGASIAVLLLLLHSIVDYPLRTTALSTLFAFGCALLIPPRRTE